MDIQKIMKQLEKDEIKFITLQFTDLLGVIKEVIKPVEEFESSASHGVWFDGSSVEGFARIQESDLFLKPDLTTYAVVPWLTEEGKTARFICDIYGADGEPFEGDPRYVLKRAAEDAAKQGYEYNVGPEPEFYIFRAQDHTRTEPLDYGSYFDLSSHQGYKVIKQIVAALESFGINVEASHHEVGFGQYEIDFNYGPCLAVADKVLTLKYCAKKIAQTHSLHATFMPKPIMGKPGSGMHVHQSLFNVATRTNAFYDGNQQYNLSRSAFNFIAGQIKHINGMCAILCPIVNSYKRLVSGFEAPVYVTWAGMNRSALLRIPKWFKAKPDSARIELRNPDPTCNPYLAFAVMLTAGVDGIKNDMEPPEAVEENIYELDHESRIERKINLLPTSLAEAIEALKNDPLLRETLGEHLFERYVDVKMKEWNEFKQQVTQWELETYLDTF
jgi:glutamine synthetase